MPVKLPAETIRLSYTLPAGITPDQAARLDDALQQQLETLLSFLPDAETAPPADPPVPTLSVAPTPGKRGFAARPRCQGNGKSGKPCGSAARADGYCHHHSPGAIASPDIPDAPSTDVASGAHNPPETAEDPADSRSEDEKAIVALDAESAPAEAVSTIDTVCLDEGNPDPVPNRCNGNYCPTHISATPVAVSGAVEPANTADTACGKCGNDAWFLDGDDVRCRLCNARRDPVDQAAAAEMLAEDRKRRNAGPRVA